METVKLSEIVMKFTPELYPFLREKELESYIVLKNGLDSLQPRDVLEIVQYSISQYQKDALVH